MPFEQTLQQIALDPNLGRGFITASAAELMAKKQSMTTSILANLNQGLSAMDDDIKTTEEQLKNLRLDPNAEDLKVELTKTAEELTAFTINMADRQKKYGDTFNKSILALGIVGGEEAERSIDTLQKNKAETFARFEELKKLPIQDLQYRMLEQNFAWNSSKYDEYKYDTAFSKGVNSVANWVTGYTNGVPNVPEFERLTAGDYKTWSDDDRRAYDRNFANVMKKTQEQFRGSPNQERVLDGVKRAMEKTNKTLTFNKLQPMQSRGGGSGTSSAPLDSNLIEMIRRASNDTDLFYSLNDDVVNAIYRRYTDATIPVEDLASEAKLDVERFKELYDTFNPNGTYNSNLNQLKQWLTPLNTGDPDWEKTFLEQAQRDYVDETGKTIEITNDKGELVKKKINFKKFKDKVNFRGEEYNLGRLGLNNIMIPIRDNFIAPTSNRDAMFYNGGKELWMINNRGRIFPDQGFRDEKNKGINFFDYDQYLKDSDPKNNSNIFAPEIFDDAFYRFDMSPFNPTEQQGDATNVKK